MVMGAPERLNPPRVLGEMTLLATLGEGGMATVYLAGVGQGALARLNAVKLLRAESPDRDYRTRFMDEAKVVVRLHHNNLVDVHAAGEIDGRLYICMEAIEGRDLSDIWNRCAEQGKAFPISLAIYICREVLRGLHYAHSAPGLALVHRDVSPSNILVDWAGAVRVADFGLATSTLKASLTLPGVVFGKVGYMSPEQALHRPLDPRSDVYSVGTVLWELITGRPMRDPESLTTEQVAIFEAEPPSALSRRVDPELDAIVMKALANAREERWPNAETMMKALGDWLSRYAPEMGQERCAEFMTTLFGDAREEEHAFRQRLLREVTGGQRTKAVETARTRVFARRPAREVRERKAKESGDPASSADAKEGIPAGTVIADRYRVLSYLGQGGMGTVYLGEHVTVGRSVAIKVLTQEWSGNDAVTDRFRAEARAASAAGHPNIIEVFDAGELDDGRLYLVMEFLTGRTLHEELRDVGIPELGRTCRIIRDTARAIRAAHEVGIVHRDLKPDNIMLVDRGAGEGESVKVLDFGISASVNHREQGRLTVDGQTLGTPEYMAPEQAQGKEATESFDIYALGVLFYELLVGEPPFKGSNIIEVMTRKATQSAPSLGRKRGDLPTCLIELVDDCLEIEPEDRPANVRMFLARLESIIPALISASDPVAGSFAAGKPSVQPVGSSASPVNRRRRLVVGLAYGLGGFILALGLGLVVWKALTPADEAQVMSLQTQTPGVASAMSASRGQPEEPLEPSRAAAKGEISPTPSSVGRLTRPR